MDMIDIAIAKAFATKVAAGFSNVEVNGMTINFTLNDGTTTSLTVPTPADGVSVTDINIDENGNLICTMSDETEVNAGKVTPTKGVDYYTPEEIEEVKDDILTDLQERIDLLTSEYTAVTSESSNNIIIENAINYYNQGNIKIGDGTEITQDSTSISEGDEYDSPSPDHPQTVNVVEGECGIGESNKNQIDLSSNKWQQGFYNYTTGVLNSNNYRVCQKDGIIFNSDEVVTISGPANLAFYISEFDKNDNYIGRHADWYNYFPIPVTYTFAKNRKYKINLGAKNNSFLLTPSDLSGFDVQLELGSISTSCIQHKGKSFDLTLPEGMFLGSIGTASNYIYGTKDNWKLVSGFGKLFLNGDKNWGANGTTNYQLTLSGNNRINLKQSGVGLSNYFPVKTNGNDIYLYPILQGNTDYIRISNAVNKWETVQDFKNWLLQNEVVFLYPKATPTETPITDTTLISQLNNIADNLQTYKDQTIIITTGENLAPNIQFDYFTSSNESNSNKVTNISSESTDEQYPSAKAVYSYVETKLASFNSSNSTLTIKTASLE